MLRAPSSANPTNGDTANLTEAIASGTYTDILDHAFPGTVHMETPTTTVPVALFSFEPECAVVTVEACLAERLHIPDQVSVLCMHGVAFLNECSVVPLSSIDVDYDAKARLACELLEPAGCAPPPPHRTVFR